MAPGYASGMCHDPESRPPAPPQVGAVAESALLTLTAADGASLSAAYSLPATPPKAAIVVLPDVRGLHGYYVALTGRLAEAGFAAVAIDFFARTAGLAEDGVRGSDFDYAPHIEETTPEAIDLDTAAAIDYVRSRTTADIPVFTLGFCFGGSNAWRQSAGSLDLGGVMGFYGQPQRVGDAAQHAAKPVLMLIAGDDFLTPVEDQLALASVMRLAGADVVDVVLPGAPHSFFDRSSTEWSSACDESWRQIIAFVQ